MARSLLLDVPLEQRRHRLLAQLHAGGAHRADRVHAVGSHLREHGQREVGEVGDAAVDALGQGEEDREEEALLVDVALKLVEHLLRAPRDLGGVCELEKQSTAVSSNQKQPEARLAISLASAVVVERMRAWEVVIERPSKGHPEVIERSSRGHQEVIKEVIKEVINGTSTFGASKGEFEEQTEAARSNQKQSEHRPAVPAEASLRSKASSRE